MIYLKELHFVYSVAKRKDNMKRAIVNINVEFEFPDEVSDEEIEKQMMEVDLPDNYVSESIELVKIIKE